MKNEDYAKDGYYIWVGWIFVFVFAFVVGKFWKIERYFSLPQNGFTRMYTME